MQEIETLNNKQIKQPCSNKDTRYCLVSVESYKNYPYTKKKKKLKQK